MNVLFQNSFYILELSEFDIAGHHWILKLGIKYEMKKST